MYPILMNAISQECLERISSSLDELIEFGGYEGQCDLMFLGT